MAVTRHADATSQGSWQFLHRWTQFSVGKFAALGTAAVILLVFCVYRILTFVPQPFDSPATLRPIVYACFSRFVRSYSSPEEAQRAWGTYCIVALLIPAILAFWNYLYSRSANHSATRLHKVIGSRPVLFGSIGVCLIVCRFPYLLANQINPDETFFIAAAEKLFKDPVFFRAVDFETSGPLNVYPLMLPAVFGISPDYVSTRLIALSIIFASIYVIYRTLALLTDDGTARIALLPVAGAFAVFKLGEFLPYSSEHLSFLLLSLALYLCVRTIRRPASHRWNLAGLGALTAAAFLAKMQAVPILAGAAFVAIACVHGGGHAGRWWRPSLLFAAGLVPLLLVNALVCVLAGVWHDFWMEYIVANYHYAAPGGSYTSEVQRFADFAVGVTEIRLLAAGLLGILAAYAWQRWRRESAGDPALFVQLVLEGGAVALTAEWCLRTAGGAVLAYSVLIAMLALPASFVLICRQRKWTPDPVTWFGFLTAAILAAAVAAAYVPHHLFGHYLLLLVLPLTMATAWPAVAASAGADGDLSPRHSPLPLLLAFGTLTLAGQLFELGSPDFVTLANVPATVAAPESRLIESLTRPNEGIAIWGWNGQPYVGAGRVAALKDLFSAQLFLTTGAVRTYYRAAYLRGLRRRRPALFIDATDTSFPRTLRDRKTYGLDRIPEIDSFIRSNYVQVVDAYAEQFYIRRDLAYTRSPQYPFPQSGLAPLWRATDPAPQFSQARIQVRRNWIEVTPLTADPQLLFDIGPSLGRFRTLIVRAWFEKTDRIDAFFGRQVDGRGVNAVVPMPGQWLDVYLNISQNPYWNAEHGTTLRFDPVSSFGPGTTARIAGIWGSTLAAPAGWPDVQFYAVPQSERPE